MANSIFNPVSLQIGNILKDVETGRIGLPDLQRPFVWKPNQVADLFDSMFKGYPIGYIMLWDSDDDYLDKSSDIGLTDKVYKKPKQLVIDGQQRLTALFSSFYGVEVKDKDFNSKPIKIAFDPIKHDFKVWNGLTDKSYTYIPDVSEVFDAYRNNTVGKYRRKFIAKLNEYYKKKGLDELTEEGKDEIEDGINLLLDLQKYSVPTLDIDSSADEEMVADIFVRVNSKGQSLKQDDFIMTLLSVYEPGMRQRIADFCESSHIPKDGTAYNPLGPVTATLIIRATVALGFQRGRLRYAYKILTGKDLQTNKTNSEIRAANFKNFGDALDKVLDLNDWHSFINIACSAGFVCEAQMGSMNALFMNYALYLIGKHKFKMDSHDLRRLIKRWLFTSILHEVYTGSFESYFEAQLNAIKDLNTPSEFADYIENQIAVNLTDDYFTRTLPDVLNANNASGPSWNTFVASQVVLGYRSFMGDENLGQLLAPGASGTKKSLDKHHIFPDHYLEESGLIDNRNARANFALAFYPDNIYISDDAPDDYVSRYRSERGEDAYKKLCAQQALPEDFENMNYEEFLEKRRILMAELIHDAFNKL